MKVESNVEGLPQHFSKITPITRIITLDEKAWMLIETNVVLNNVWTRCQVIYVNRDGNMARFTRAIGPSSAFTFEGELICPSEWVLSVGQLIEFAEHQRNDDYWEKFLAEEQAGSTLKEDWVQQLDRQRDMIANRSVIGPSFRKQNGEFSRDAFMDIVRQRKEIHKWRMRA